MKLDKALGQHFLTNPGVVEKIIQKIESFGHKEVIEIGPGGGALTEDLLAQGYRVIAVEFDERWFRELEKKFADKIACGFFKILHADATQVDLDLLQSLLHEKTVTLCGNLPYNRGQEITLRYFEEAPFVDSFVVMLQKEVVDKFLPKNSRKCYGPLSIKMHFLADKIDSFFVSPGSFQPPPKVDSAVLSFKRAESEMDPLQNKDLYDSFSTMLKSAFNQRRKKLSNNLKASAFDEKFKEFAAKRAEELNPEEFLKLFYLKK